ncbi:MAG TPA: hypothetical protein VNZ52_13445 [Candidatus Thermoplasmatota archaeon]|nr:hypothetical protein [Candidatus Thermoplasmatota archaeon]
MLALSPLSHEEAHAILDAARHVQGGRVKVGNDFILAHHSAKAHVKACNHSACRARRKEA